MPSRNQCKTEPWEARVGASTGTSSPINPICIQWQGKGHGFVDWDWAGNESSGDLTPEILQSQSDLINDYYADVFGEAEGDQ